MSIPKIIHQIWLGKLFIPLVFKRLSDSWQTQYLDWEYFFWNTDKATEFVNQEFPQYVSLYNTLSYDVQRVDLLKYLILLKFGGVYIDIDYEPLKSIEPILENQALCFGLEPKQYSDFHQAEYFLGNAFMASIPNHEFLSQLVEHISDNLASVDIPKENKYYYVMNSTGPLLLNNFYQSYLSKQEVTLIPSEQICPLDSVEAKNYFLGGDKAKYRQKLEKSFAIHLFAGTWL